VRRLNFKDCDGAFEVRNKKEIQFILVHDINRNTNCACNVGYAEYSKVTQEYINEIVSAIDSYYA
jgi:hypothetical protein